MNVALVAPARIVTGDTTTAFAGLPEEMETVSGAAGAVATLTVPVKGAAPSVVELASDTVRFASSS